MKNILAVDLGTNCGIAYNAGILWTCETRELATAKELKIAKLARLNRRNDIRCMRLFIRLADLHRAHKFNIVVFEDVLFASSTYAVQLWSALRSALWLAFSFQSEVIIECVPVGTLKKFATGHGGATKEMMSAALQRQHPDKWNSSLGEDAIDAAWLWHWANTHLTRTPAGAIVPNVT